MMTVKTKTHKFLMTSCITLIVIGFLFLLRIIFVLGMASYVNAEAQKEDGNMDMVANYYLLQAGTGDFMEPYIAYYNAGTALAKAGQPIDAEFYLKAALSKVDYAPNECYVRANLAMVQEQLGDYYRVAGMLSTAEKLYSDAVTTIAESPMTCFPPPPPSGGDGDQNPEGEGSPGEDNPLTPQDKEPSDHENGEKMKETEERSSEKEREAKESQDESSNGKEQVEQEMNQSSSDTSNQEDANEQRENQGNPVDKPW